MAWPTTDDPKTELLTVRFTKTEVAALDLYARSLGVSRSRAVRDAVGSAVAKERRRENKQKGRKK